MSKKAGLGALGKGLGAIFGENNAPKVEDVSDGKREFSIANGENAQEIAVEEILSNPFQPRQKFDTEKLLQLADSLKEHGVVEPLIVRRVGSSYQLVAGERRLRAARIAGLKSVPSVVRDYTDLQTREIALVENINRDDLNPIEEAQALKALMEECKLTQEQVGAKVGRSRVAVTNLLRLLNLPQQLQTQIANNELPMGQARALLTLSKAEQQLAVAKEIVANGWSARMTEEVVRLLKEGKKPQVIREFIIAKSSKKAIKSSKDRNVQNTDIFCRDFESNVREWLGTKVTILPLTTDKKGKTAGTVQIEYYSAEDLQRIYEILQDGISNSRAKANLSQDKPRRLHV